eukprot:TRINITY_DN9064_c0_g1_i1.p1 TRINITY_DN9064_c0_g1~~TRINITY_DN9064_c0_g1_i1.p1  ORF type:complete len:433 (-),score=112.13 TRINITY_DN9064_c0_g1_i1:929-2077(-)
MVGGAIPPIPPTASGYGIVAGPGPPGVRMDAPDVGTVECDTCPGGYAISAAANGDFFSYTATVAKAGKYVVGANVGSASHVPKGSNVVVLAGAGECIERPGPYDCNAAQEPTASMALDAAFTSTGGLAVFKTFMGDPILLPAGDVCLQLCSLGDPVSVSDIGVWAAYEPAKVTIPGVVEAENFDVGKAGVAYFDTTPANNGMNLGYRPDAPSVDIEVGNNDDKVMSNGADLNWIAAGEWWRYTVTAATPQATYSAAMSAGREVPTPDAGPMALVLTVPGACAATEPLDCGAKYNYGPRATPADPALLLSVVFPAALADGYYTYQTIGSGADGVPVEMGAGQHCIQVTHVLGTVEQAPRAFSSCGRSTAYRCALSRTTSTSTA